MKEKICEACHASGKANAGKCRDAIYHTSGDVTYLRLCYYHSVELFKYGQTNFLSKYRPYSVEYDDKEMFDPLKNYFVFNSFR